MRKLSLLCVVVLTMLSGCALTPMKLNIESPRNFNPIRLAAEVLTENDWLVDDIDTRIIRTNYKYRDRMDHRLRVRANVIFVGNRNFKIRFDKEVKNNDGHKYNEWCRTSQLNTAVAYDILDPLIASFERRGARVTELD